PNFTHKLACKFDCYTDANGESRRVFFGEFGAGYTAHFYAAEYAGMSLGAKLKGTEEPAALYPRFWFWRFDSRRCEQIPVYLFISICHTLCAEIRKSVR